MTRLFNAIALTTLAAVATACNSTTSPVAPSAGNAPTAESSARPDFAAGAKPGNLTIVGIVTQDDGEFDLLQAAVIRAGLVDALNGTTQYTVFAPTDAAFVTTLGTGTEAGAISAVNGMDVDTLASLMGNSPAVIRQHYSHLLADRQGLREKLERFRDAAATQQ